jgi:hypothetical protein
MYNLYDELQHISHVIQISNDRPANNTNLTSNAARTNQKRERHNTDQFSCTVQKFREVTIVKDSFMPLLKKNSSSHSADSCI